MNKGKIFIKIMSVFIVAIFCFIWKSYGESEEPEEGKMGYTELLEKYKLIKRDRDNLLLQTKRLLEQKKNTRELEESLEQRIQAERELVEKEKDQILAEYNKFKEDSKELIGQLKDNEISLKDEINSLKIAYENSKEGARIKELEQAIADLEKEKKETISFLKEQHKDQLYLLKSEKQEEVSSLKKDSKEEISSLRKEKDEEIYSLKKESKEEISSLKKELSILKKDFSKSQKELTNFTKMKERADRQIEELSDDLTSTKKDLAEAVEKNRGLEREVKDVPKKFSEIARQNKILIKETGQMHYNLGVFYTKKREYRRAITEFVKAIEMNPDDCYAHFNLGYIYAEYLVDREKAITHFRHYLRLAKGNDKDVDWVRKYLLTWETYEGQRPMQ